ncbi:MAG: DUF4623 domain-containing protein [Planctomycetales bacterium]|nr:DUF4623 domain-containing protein [Planctomycetales bacterium]
MKLFHCYVPVGISLVVALGTLANCPARAATLDPLLTFGGGDGWREPGELLPGDAAGVDGFSPGSYAYLGSTFMNDLGTGQANLERGLAFNPATGNLVLVSRSSAGNGIRILDGATGVDVGALDQGAGVISGGTFTTNMVGIAEDGAIYVGNLSTNNATSPFKVYRWENESSTPTVAYDSVLQGGILSGARIGDTLDVIGSGSDTRLVAGYSRFTPVSGNNSFAIFDTDNGLSFDGTHVAIGADPPTAGDFALGITFADADTILGKQTDFGYVVDVDGTTGSVVSPFETDGSTLRPMDYAVVDGRPLLAILEASSSIDEIARARLFIYDMSDPALPVAERKIGEVSALPAGFIQDPNVNGTGQVKFGPINGRTAVIYALSTNNGIQAFELTLDPAAVDTADFNSDGVVDGSDFLTWQTGFGLAEGAASRQTGDANSDGSINADDFVVWSSQFGEPAVATVAVPEPVSITTLAIASAMLVSLRRSRF